MIIQIIVIENLPKAEPGADLISGIRGLCNLWEVGSSRSKQPDNDPKSSACRAGVQLALSKQSKQACCRLSPELRAEQEVGGCGLRLLEALCPLAFPSNIQTRFPSVRNRTHRKNAFLREMSSRGSRYKTNHLPSRVRWDQSSPQFSALACHKPRLQ